ncbi:MAG: hypothetical protein KA765_20050 [Thermoflexales bacterium]|nr:hypothetical protein [Thermoflexales bacterium]
MKDERIDLQFWECRRSGPDVFGHALRIVSDAGAAFYGKDERVVAAGEFASMAAAKSWESERYGRQSATSGPLIRGVSDLMATTTFGRIVTRGAPRFATGGLLVWSSQYLSAPTKFVAAANRVAEALDACCVALYDLLQPEFGAIDTSLSYWDTDKMLKTRKPSLTKIGWVTLFGPAYVDWYGASLLSEIPGATVTPLSDGGLKVTLGPSLFVSAPSVAREIRQRVVEYFASHGHKVNCRGPHFLRSSGGEASDVDGPDKQLQAYFDQIEATTLVLVDDTRLKVIELGWRGYLYPGRRYVADRIGSMITHEMKAHAGVLALEFDIMFPEVLDVLRPLKDQYKDRLKWSVARHDSIYSAQPEALAEEDPAGSSQ